MTAKAILLSGLGGRLFSCGLYGIAAQLRAMGVETSVHGWRYYRQAADDMQAFKAANPDGRVILIGFSQGAIRAVEASYLLAERAVTVDLVVTLIPGGNWLAAFNVRRFTNFYIEGGWLSNAIKPAPGFMGRLKNIDLSGDPSVWHITIDKLPHIWGLVAAEVRGIL